MVEWNTITYEFLNPGEPLTWQPVYVYYSDTDQLKTLSLKGYDDFYGNNERVRWSDNSGQPEDNIFSAQAVTKALYRVVTENSKQNFAGNKGNPERVQNIKKIVYSGKTALNMGMFMTRDKVPFISYVNKMDGSPLIKAKVILEGSSNRLILDTDLRGIVAEYVPADTYSNAMVISRSNIVYKLIELETLEDYMYKMKLKRATKANVPYRQIHRAFD